MSEVTGKCLCGQITVSIANETFHGGNNITVCHCKNCRQAGGTTGSVNVIAPDPTVKITGHPKIYEDRNTESGNMLVRAFCDNCGCPIYTSPSGIPGLKVVKLGLFDEIPKPTMEIYCKSKFAWEKPIEDAKEFEAMPAL